MYRKISQEWLSIHTSLLKKEPAIIDISHLLGFGAGIASEIASSDNWILQNIIIGRIKSLFGKMKSRSLSHFFPRVCCFSIIQVWVIFQAREQARVETPYPSLNTQKLPFDFISTSWIGRTLAEKEEMMSKGVQWWMNWLWMILNGVWHQLSFHLSGKLQTIGDSRVSDYLENSKI